MNIAFFGSPDIAKDILEYIHHKFPVSLVVSQPDKPVGRKKILTATAVSNFAKTHEIPLITPETPQSITLNNIDLAIVVAYGKILSQTLLNQPKYGFINVHYSLLPKYRGASPVQAAILNNDRKTGVTIMKVDEKLDHGELILQKETDIDINDTTESLLKELTEQSKPILFETINYIEKHNSLPELTPQDHSKATYCNRITKQDAFFEYKEIKNVLHKKLTTYNLQLTTLHNMIRAYYPWPNVWTILPNGKRCKIISSHIEHLTRHPEQSEGSSSDLIDSSSDTQQTQNDIKLYITQIQIEGKAKTKDSKLINITFRNI